MTLPIIPDGPHASDPMPAPPPSSGGAIGGKTQIVHFLGNTVLTVPNLINFRMANIKPVFKQQHDVAKELITKFKPVLTELAVLALRSQHSQPKVDKPPASTPGESGTRRDEATPKGSTTLGKDIVNIEVHGGEEGRNDPQQQQSNPQAKTAVPEAKKDEAIPVMNEAISEQVPKSEGEVVVVAPEMTEGENPTQLGGDKNLVAPKDPTEAPQVLPPEEIVEKEVFNQNTRQEQSPATQIVASKAAQETQTKPVEVVQPKELESPVAPHKTNPTDENAPDQAIGLKEVPEGEESVIPEDMEIPKDLSGQFIDKDNIILYQKHEDVAVLAFLEARPRSDEPTPTAQHKMFQNVGNDPKSFVPPWLALLLPDLIKAKTDRDKRVGGQTGQKLQKPHKLTDILFMLFSAHVAGAKSLVEVFDFIQSREKWFSVVLGLKNGMPPRQLIFWFLTVLDPKKFDLITRRWLEEVLGRNSGRPRLLDILMWETPLGLILGQTRRAEGNFSTSELTAFSDGFSWRNSVLMINSDQPYGSLFGKIEQQKGHYLAEVDRELIPTDDHEAYESYIEGQERIVVQEWDFEEETQMKVSCEIMESDSVISRFARYFISDLESPAGYYFDLFRLQRSEESKCSWMLNAALSFTSMDEALESCAATLNNFHEYAKEIITGSLLEVQQEMEKAAKSNEYLLSLLRQA